MTKWEKFEKEADLITDGLGKKIDPGIKNAVVGLWCLGIPTCMSCEGHLDWGEPAPWIDIGNEQSEEVAQKRAVTHGTFSFKKFFEMYPELVELRRKNLSVQKKILALLTQYYQNHPVDEHRRLTLTPLDVYGIVRLSNQGRELQEINILSTKKKTLNIYQQEMTSFAQFLKTKGT